MAEWNLSRKDLNKYSEDPSLLAHIVTILMFIIMLSIISLTTKIYIEWSYLIFKMININIITPDIRSHIIELDFLLKFVTEVSFFNSYWFDFFLYPSLFDIIKNICTVIESWFSVLVRVENHSKIIILLLMFNRDWVWKQKRNKVYVLSIKYV